MPLAYRSREEEKPTTNTPPEEIPLGIQNLAVEVGVDAAREVSVHGAFVYCMEENAPGATGRYNSVRIRGRSWDSADQKSFLAR